MRRDLLLAVVVVPPDLLVFVETNLFKKRTELRSPLLQVPSAVGREVNISNCDRQVFDNVLVSSLNLLNISEVCPPYMTDFERL